MSAISDFVKKDDLMNLYHLPMKEACKALGVSESSLRNICRKYSIERWPFRKFQQLDQHIESIRHAPASPKNTEMVQVLTLARGIMQKNPNLSVELAIVQGNKQLAVQHQQNQLQATANFLQKQQQQEMMMQQQPMQQASTSSVSTNTLTPAMQVTPANTTAPATFAQQQPFVQQIPQQQQHQQNPFLLPHVMLPNTSSTNTTAVPTSMSYAQNPFGNVLFADASGVYGYGAMLPNALMMQQLHQQQQQQQQQQMIPMQQIPQQQQQQPVHHIKLQQQQQQVPSTSTAQQQQPMHSPLLQTSWYPQQQQQQVPSSQQIIIKQSPNLAPTTMERSASTDNTSQFFQ